MIARTVSGGLRGIAAHIVHVEVDVSRGLPTFDMVGLPDTGARESKERVRAAIRNSGWEFPLSRITINLAPSGWRKIGSGFDLPIALGILQAAGRIPPCKVSALVTGELALDGQIRGVAGVFCMAEAARSAGIPWLIVPHRNAAEAALVPGVRVAGVRSLSEAVAIWKRLPHHEPFAAPASQPSNQTGVDPDLADVRGQETGRRVLEIAAAGGHNVLLVGAPGSGKTMLARCLPGIMPDLDPEEALEVARIHSATGRMDGMDRIEVRPPFRAPHHSITRAGMLGGGSRLRPGEVTLAHRGVLFLDELPEFSPAVLESLRQPVEEGDITLSRHPERVTYPSRFILVAAANPCPCGFLGDPVHECRCRGARLSRYAARLSGPLADRIDLHLRVERLSPDSLTKLATESGAGESSQSVRERVVKARMRQRARYADGVRLNGHLTRAFIPDACRLSPSAIRLLEAASASLHLSARGVDRVLRVSRTIADLDGAEEVHDTHLAEALQYRRPVWLHPEGG